MEQALVTIVIPTYRRPAMLREALESVLAQTFTNYRVLVCDNASADDTERVVTSFNDPRIGYHRHSQNIGGQQNWKYALTSATTKYVALLEDDNLYLPHHLADAIDALERHPRPAFFAAATQTFGSSGGHVIQPFWIDPNLTVHTSSPREHAAQWLGGMHVSVSSLVMPSTFMSHVVQWGGRNWPACMDYLWLGQIALAADFLFANKVGAKYRYHGSNWSVDWGGSGVGGIEMRYVVRTLANMGLERALLLPDQLASEAMTWPTYYASLMVTALAAPEAAPALRDAARRVLKARRDLRHKPATFHTRATRFLGRWTINYADRVHRWRRGWPPRDGQ